MGTMTLSFSLLHPCVIFHDLSKKRSTLPKRESQITCGTSNLSSSFPFVEKSSINFLSRCPTFSDSLGITCYEPRKISLLTNCMSLNEESPSGSQNQNSVLLSSDTPNEFVETHGHDDQHSHEHDLSLVHEHNHNCSHDHDHNHNHDHDHDHDHGHGEDHRHTKIHAESKVAQDLNGHKSTLSTKPDGNFCCSSHNHSHDDHSHDDHSHDHEHDHDHDHHHHHHHGDDHSHSHSHSSSLNPIQKGIVQVARAIRLTDAANAMRDSIPLAVASLALCVAAFLVDVWVKTSTGQLVQNVLVAVAFTLTGVPALLDASLDVFGGHINIHVLMALAAFASIFMGNALEGALLLAMFSISHSAEEYFTEKALGDVNRLRESNPESAVQLDDFDASSPPPLSSIGTRNIPVEDIMVGTYLLVKQGEAVPVDGVVWQGQATVTVEHLTGESKPLAVTAGDAVPGGARTLDGVLVIKVQKVWSDSTVARIMRLTAEARLHRPKLQRWLNAFGEKYSQAVVVASLATALLGPRLFGWPLMTTAAGNREKKKSKREEGYGKKVGFEK